MFASRQILLIFYFLQILIPHFPNSNFFSGYAPDWARVQWSSATSKLFEPVVDENGLGKYCIRTYLSIFINVHTELYIFCQQTQ